MRETRQSGSEGGVRSIPHPYPYPGRELSQLAARPNAVALRICRRLVPCKHATRESPDSNTGLAVCALRIEAIRAPGTRVASTRSMTDCSWLSGAKPLARRLRQRGITLRRGQLQGLLKMRNGLGPVPLPGQHQRPKNNVPGRNPG